MYNVLEEPDQEPSENPNYFGSILSEQPVYNTLQSPFGSGEDPECINEAIYNTLEETSPPNFEAEDEVQFVEINFVKCNVFELNIQIVLHTLATYSLLS